MKLGRYSFVFVLLLSLHNPAFASRWVEATGSAVINQGAVQLAREQATQNAIRQAMMQSEAAVDSTSTISSNVLVIESARVNAAGTVEDIKVLDEWSKDNNYFVRIRAFVPKDKVRKPSPAARYRKKVAVMQFEILDRTQTHDLPNIERALPLELLRRLESTDSYIGIDATQYLASKKTAGLRIDEPEVYSRLANKIGAQIIISGIIRDMGVKKSWIWLKDRRHLEVEIFVHDGLSGARIARHRFSENVKEGDYFSDDNSALFSNAHFMQTPYGRALNTVLARQVEMVHDDLEQLPFTARVVQVNGSSVHFDAGGTSLVKVGDVLMTYRMSAEPLRASNKQFLGYEETPLAALAVNQTQPNFAIGTLEAEKIDLKPGDIIRFGW
ncbi:MAG: flagellar assembly protein FlgT [Gammaproteobacteria bacterium]|nr:flagellar assembly protein FlgT [Gammaproteobacteria bacterium]